MSDPLKILCVTNRSLCSIDFLTRIEEIARCVPAGIILREKDMTAAAYKALAREVLRICGRYGVPCILHTFPSAAAALGAHALHLPLPLLREMPTQSRMPFTTLGASCHSVEEAVEAEKRGCTYLTAGHIFTTDCKKGVPPRGLPFLQEVCRSVTIPVYAIGGVNSQNIRSVQKAGAKGVCIMSGLMRCEDPKAYFEKLCYIS